MKKFLIISSILLVITIVLVVIVFYYVSFQLKSGQNAADTADAPATTINEKTGTPATISTATPTPIPLRDLPINDSQQKVLETVGVEIDTFVITPAMQVCAAEKLGADRMANIVSGDTPTALETARLVPCLGAE
ncbi:MAG: hypothetical protein KBC35_02385 [Candidatus Pacebacteria bacterium]|nr:hypothetical protein [Candidatus Paceibacterota bacterium]